MKMIDLKSIKGPSDVKKLSIPELHELCSEIRRFLIESISKTGGHLSSNLGVVELTVAMYYVFDLDKDELLFDVGHQAYVHKILSGRAAGFDKLRQYGGLSGYINRNESKYDVWESGHSSTSISAASGLMLSGEKRDVVVIGDCSIMNGVAFEGLNFLGQFKKLNPIIILNDNEMGISKSVGALSKTFKLLRGSRFKRRLKAIVTKIFPSCIPNACHSLKNFLKMVLRHYNVFESLGFDYYGPYNGNDLNTMIKVLRRIEKNKKPVILHINTKKGMGYKPSEGDKIGNYHGVAPFDIETGKPLADNSDKLSYSQIVGHYLVKKREKEEFVVITPAVKVGVKLGEFANSYPDDFYDVGIAEEHAAVMAAGIALRGRNVVLLMYSTFAQRAYDEILNDIVRQNLKVIIGIDRAGIVGEDGVTHQGIYDVSMFMGMPNIVVTMPKDEQEAIGLFNYAFIQKSPIVIRYPRASEKKLDNLDYDYVASLSWTTLNEGSSAIVISYGMDVERISRLVEANRLDVMVINARSIKPIDEEALNKAFSMNKPILVVEQVVASGTLYHQILDFKERNGYLSRVYPHSFTPNELIPHGSMADIYKLVGFSDDELIEKIKEIM